MPKVRTRMCEAVVKMRHQLTSNNDIDINVDSFFDDLDFERSIDRELIKKEIYDIEIKID